MAPEWTLKRLDGTTLKSAELAGKVVVVDFWATWCPPCVEEIPGYVEMQREHEAAGLVIVGISLDQAGVEAVRKFTERYAMNYPVVMNGGGGDGGVWRGGGDPDDVLDRSRRAHPAPQGGHDDAGGV